MVRWEYKRLNQGWFEDIVRAGQEGWEMVCSTSTSVLWFKRPIETTVHMHFEPGKKSE